MAVLGVGNYRSALVKKIIFMPTPTGQIAVSGTPNTSQQGTGAVAGNAITIGGLTLAPNQPGWTLIQSVGGQGFVGGTWKYSSNVQPQALPVQGAFYRSGTGGSGGGGGSGDSEVGFYEQGTPPQNFQLSKTGWLILGLLTTLLLTDKKR